MERRGIGCDREGYERLRQGEDPKGTELPNGGRRFGPIITLPQKTEIYSTKQLSTLVRYVLSVFFLSRELCTLNLVIFNETKLNTIFLEFKNYFRNITCGPNCFEYTFEVTAFVEVMNYNSDLDKVPSIPDKG